MDLYATYYPYYIRYDYKTNKLLKQLVSLSTVDNSHICK